MVDVNTLTLKDSSFPEVLRHVSPPLKQLFWTGNSIENWIHQPKVAIVGSRRVTPYGKYVTQRLTTELAEAGVVIISGLALGMDSVAHKAALDAGGITIAVLPCGLDKVYPSSHTYLAKMIVESGGALVSEHPPNTAIYKYRFIERNRIVSALADVLLITEATAKSGTMHTARFGLEQGTTVMAVPGNINNPSSEGCNNLIKGGAVPVTSAGDIFFALGINPDKSGQRSAKFKGTDAEELIIKLIGQGQTSQEALAMSTKLQPSEMISVLTILEIGGYIRPTGGGNWSLC